MFNDIITEILKLENLLITTSVDKPQLTVWCEDMKMFSLQLTGSLIEFKDDNYIYYCSSLTDAVNKIHAIYKRKKDLVS